MTTAATLSPPAPAPPAQVRDVASVPVLLALLAVLAGVVAAGLYLAPQSPGEGSVDVGFARDMSAHHQQAVAMAETIRDRTADPELRVLAADVALTQQAQIGRMSAWLDQWAVPQTSQGPRMAWMGMPTTGRMPGMAGPDELAALSTLPVAQAEASFLRMMVAHHAGGVTMAQAGAALAREPQVRALAEGIAAAQTAEIQYLQSLLAARGQPPATVPFETGMGGVTGSHEQRMGPSRRDAVLLSVVALGLLAFAWLLLDAVVRHAGARRTPAGAAGLVLTAAAVLSAAVHLVLSPSHAREQPAYGLFFMLAAVVLLAGAATGLAGLRRAGAAISGTASLLLILTYVAFRIVPPPGSAAAEHVDGWGLTAIGAELLALGAAFWLLRRQSGDQARQVASG